MGNARDGHGKNNDSLSRVPAKDLGIERGLGDSRIQRKQGNKVKIVWSGSVVREYAWHNRRYFPTEEVPNVA